MPRQIPVRRSAFERLLVIATLFIVGTAVASLPLFGFQSVGSSEKREIYISAHMWDFHPSTIVVNKGEKVILKLTSLDTRHGFHFDMLNITATLEPKKTIEIEFVADRAGVFFFSCTVFCGLGHSEMKGQIIVADRM